MSFIGEAALSVFMEMLIGKLASFAINFVKDYKQVREQLKQWQSILPDIQGVLNDAEEKQIKDERVKSWLVDLTQLAYDVDDILDEFVYEELRLKLQETQAQASTSKLRKLIPACCTTGIFTPSAFKFNTRMVSAIKEITSRLNVLATRRRNLGLVITESNEGASSKRMEARRPQTTSLPDEPHLYGRENEKQKILGWLKSKRNEVSVFPIIGMGGMGKTTLAQFVYNHNDAKKVFDLKAWVCVSEEFDAFGITKTILQSVMDPEPCPNPDKKDGLDFLQRKLNEKLSEKSFLLVLDDVWNENYVELSNLIKPLGVGTKIILTTRSKKVASIIGTIEEPCMLDKLSDQDCLPIFTKHALGADDFSKCPNLEEDGKNIVKKCDGLPLAAKAIGGLLHNEDNKKWKKVAISEIWELSEEQCGILPALRLSYHCLPPHLKRCFAYCSIIPKDYEFTEEEITLLWKAEGFLQQKSESQVKDLGNEYFCELVSRSFFQPSSEDKSRFGMHDLMNDLAQLVAGDICSKLEGGKQPKLSTHTRHMSYTSNEYDGVKRFEAFNQVSHLRTFLPLMLPDNWGCYLTNVVLGELLPRLGCLRVLSLNGYYITELPDFFENLIHLRYLDFSNTCIKSLPDSICSLHHLETLILRRCITLEKLPSDMGNLFKLHYLDIRGSILLRKMPLGIDHLINLQKLFDLSLDEGKGCRIQEIRNFSGQHLCLSGLDSITEVNDAREAKLSDKVDIDELELKWSMNFGNNKRDEKVEEKVLDFLYPHKMVKKLSIENYGGINFSAWITDPSFTCLSSLKLKNCRNCKLLPPIGRLPLLKDVWISEMVEVTKVGPELFGVDKTIAFASLESLHFEDMLNWKEWDCFGVEEEQVLKFPKLRELYLMKCPQLVGRLPNHLHSLQKLVIKWCKRLVVSVSSLPLLCELEINECEDLIYSNDADFTSLKKVTLFDILKYNISEERVGAVHQLSNSLETEAEEIEEETLHLAKVSRIEFLSISRCENFFSGLFKVFHSFESLTEMRIDNYSGLVCLVEINFLPALKKLAIWGCNNLQCLVDERENMVDLCSTSLLPEHLEIYNCDSLVCLSSRDDVAIRLRHLEICSCSNLNCLFLNNKFPIRLKEVKIWHCLLLESIGQEFQETSLLESITIFRSEQMKYLPRGLHKLNHLQSIYLDSCSNVVIFEEDESWLPTLLEEFRIIDCPKIEALPKSINNFTSLRSLRVEYCSENICFPEEGFPTNLTLLSISGAPKMYRSLVEWGFHKFTCLQELSIGGKGCSDVVAFPGMTQLPPPVTQIEISGFENLKCISSDGLQNLTSLQQLFIYDSPKLTSLPEKDMLLSLGRLLISNCPLLKEECKRDRGRQWSKIAHIPRVEIDDVQIIPKQLD